MFWELENVGKGILCINNSRLPKNRPTAMNLIGRSWYGKGTWSFMGKRGDTARSKGRGRLTGWNVVYGMYPCRPTVIWIS